MGNGIGKACHCFAGDGEISKRHNDVGVVLSDPLDEGLGHSFCYVRPDPPRLSYTSSNLEEDTQDRDSVATTAFRSISGASVSANTSTPISTCLADLIGYSFVDRAASFASSTSFASIPLQPVRRCSTCELVPDSGPMERGFMSGPMERGFVSGPMERGFMSGPMERGFVSGPIDSGPIEEAAREQLPIENIVKSKKRRRWFNNIFKKLISSAIAWGHKPVVGPVKGVVNASDSGGCIHLKDGEYFKERKSLQWAQGKAGEDRVQVVISEEHGWVFVGIYDGFNGPDATEYLISNLYSAVHRELMGNESQSRNFDEENEISGNGEMMDLDSNSKRKQGNSSKNKRNFESDGERSNHSEVLKALSEALRKTEDEYLDIADKMVRNNPELALIGSCVLVMLMKDEDVYLMNVGDSRAVLAQEAELDDLRPRKVHQDLKRINEDILSNQNFYFGVACGELPNLIPLQLTTDHSTYVEEEVERIRNDHPDDASAVVNERVKGYLKVTRAFGVGFLKQPKWNDALLEIFRVNYVGSSPYITCLPSLYHVRLGPRDRFLILSSDGLYQYFTNEEAVFHVESFIASFPEGDPAQHLIEEVLFRAAKKFGIDFYELLDIPQGERRRYHDDVSIIIISLEGRIWRSSM